MALGKTKINHKEIDKMKKIILLACLFVCMILVFASCADKAEEMDAKTFYEEYGNRATAAPVLQNASSLGEISRLKYLAADGEILVFTTDKETNNTTKFYNAEKNTIIYSVSEEDLLKYDTVSVWGQTLLLVAETDGEEDSTSAFVTLIDANGNQIASQNVKVEMTYDEYTGQWVTGVAELYSFVSSSADLITFDGKIYRVSDNGVSYVTSAPFAGSLPNVTKTNSYYYETDEDSFTVYTHDLKEVFYWEVAYGTVDDTFISVLSDTKVLVQMVDVLPDETTSKFDFWYYDGQKANLESIIIDVAAEKEKDIEKEVDFDYLVEGVAFHKDMVLPAKYAKTYQLPETIENVAEIYYIEDKKLNTAESVTVSLSTEDASVAVVIAPEFDSLPAEIAPGYFLYTSDSGNKYLLNSEFEVISIANGFYNSSNSNDYYVVVNGKVYNYKGTEIYAPAADEELVRLVGKSMIVRCEEDDEVVYYVVTSDGARKEIEDYVGATAQFYVTAELNKKDGTYEYTFYNADGNVILSVDDVEMYYGTVYTNYNTSNDVDFCIVGFVVDEKTEYYKITK